MGEKPAACDVICVGLIVADHVCAPIRKFPAPGGLITTPKLHLTIGGCAANVSTDLAKVGASVALVGCIGKDPFGEFVLSELRSNGVNCDHVRKSIHSQTAATMVVNVQNEDRRFIHAVGANTELTGQEVSNSLLEQAKVLYVGGFGLNPALSGENIAELFAKAHQQGVMTLLDVVLDDVSECVRMLEVALPQTDLFLPNSDEARLLTGISEPSAQAEAFIKMGAKAVVITSGPNGALFAGEDSPAIRIPSYNVQQVDGTGGGDAFVSGYIYGLIQGSSPTQCLTYGSAMGASCVQHPGATTGVFNAIELQTFVSENPLVI